MDKPITVLLITEDNKVFTGEAYQFTLASTMHHSGTTVWEMTLAGIHEPIWEPIHTKKGKAVLVTIASWFANMLKRYT